jgi:hypothetical protein
MSAWTYRCQSAGKAAQKIVPLRPRTPCWKGLGADSEEKREPVSDIDTAKVDSLKVLDTKPPIREVDIPPEGAPRSWRTLTDRHQRLSEANPVAPANPGAQYSHARRKGVSGLGRVCGGALWRLLSRSANVVPPNNRPRENIGAVSPYRTHDPPRHPKTVRHCPRG